MHQYATKLYIHLHISISICTYVVNLQISISTVTLLNHYMYCVCRYKIINYINLTLLLRLPTTSWRPSTGTAAAWWWPTPASAWTSSSPAATTPSPWPRSATTWSPSPCRATRPPVSRISTLYCVDGRYCRDTQIVIVFNVRKLKMLRPGH